LGNTIESIAREKAGIIKPGIPVVIGEYTDQTKKVFYAKGQRMRIQKFILPQIL
jgi:dihydrofolate synthase/folylpolyglutamate synthase